MKKFTSNFKLFLLLAAMVAGVNSVWGYDQKAYSYSILAGNGYTWVTVNGTSWDTSVFSKSESDNSSKSTLTGLISVTAQFYAQPILGYKFVGWYDNESCTGSKQSSTGDDNSYSYTATKSWTIKRYAKFERNNSWLWVAETVGAGDFYLVNKFDQSFLCANNSVTSTPADATLFTISGASGATIKYGSDNYVRETKGGAAWGTTSQTWEFKANADGYFIYHAKAQSGDYERYMNYDGSSVNYIRNNFTNVRRTWCLISKKQMDAYLRYQELKAYVDENNVSESIKTLAQDVLEQNDDESENSFATRISNLETMIDVYDAYEEVKGTIYASSAEQSAKDAALLELDNNRTTRSELEAVLAMLKKSAFVTNNYAGQTIYVGDDLTEVFTFDGCSPFGADFSVLSVVTDSIAAERNPLHPDSVLAYNSTTNSMAIYNAGTATITFRQNETAEYYAKDTAIVFNVVKRNPEYTYCTTNDRVYFNRQYPAFVVSTNTECAFSTLTSSNTTVATVEEVSTGIIKMVVSDQAASTTITFEQPGNYQFKASGVQTFTFTPKEAHDHVPFTLTSGNYETYAYNHVSSGGYAWKNGGILLGVENIWTATEDLRWDDRYVDLQFSGIADKLSFSFGRSVSIATDCDWYVKESVDGTTWTEIWKKDDTNSGSASNIQVSPDAHYLRLCYSGNYGGYFKNVNVTELKYFTVSETALDWGSHYVGDTGDKSFVFRHANAAGVTTITAPEHFQVSLDGTSFASSVVVATSGVDLYGEQTVYVRYLTDEVNTCTDAVLTVSDGTNEKTILLSGSTAKYPTAVILEPQFEIYVGQAPATVEFATPWTVQETINNTGVAGTFAISTPTEFLDEVMGQTITVFFTPTQANKYEECSFTATKDVLRREIVFDGEQDDAWAKDGNWNVESAPSEYDDVRISSSVVVSTDVEVHGLTIEAGKSVTVESGATLTIGAGGSRDAAEYGDLIIEAGGQVVLSGADVNVHGFYIHSEMGDKDLEGNLTQAKSGQVSNPASLVAEEAYFDVKLTPSGVAEFGWYAVALPFEVELNNGVFTTAGVKLTNERDYAIMQYQGDVRANGQYGWIKSHKVDNTLHPGVFYAIAVGDTDYGTLRFRKKSGSVLNNSVPSISVQEYASGVATDAGWNALGNPNLSHAHLEYGTAGVVQVYNHTANAFSAVEVSELNFVVGSPFFVQYDGTPVVELDAVTDNSLSLLAPQRTRTTQRLAVRLAADAESEAYFDQLYISSSDEATGEYRAGHDLAKANMGSDAARIPQMMVSGYGKQLCMAEFAPVNGQTDFPLQITAPHAANYELYLAGETDAEVYLTYNDQIIWNLSMGAYAIDLTAGENSGYGIRMVESHRVATSNTVLENGDQVEKYIQNGSVVIRKGEKNYTILGQKL